MSTCKRCGCEFDYDLKRGTGYAPDLCGSYCDGVYHERQVGALKIAGLMTQIDELRDKRDALAAELSRLRTLEAAAIEWAKREEEFLRNKNSTDLWAAFLLAGNWLKTECRKAAEAAREAEKARDA